MGDAGVLDEDEEEDDGGGEDDGGVHRVVGGEEDAPIGCDVVEAERGADHGGEGRERRGVSLNFIEGRLGGGVGLPHGRSGWLLGRAAGWQLFGHGWW